MQKLVYLILFTVFTFILTSCSEEDPEFKAPETPQQPVNKTLETQPVQQMATPQRKAPQETAPQQEKPELCDCVRASMQKDQALIERCNKAYPLNEMDEQERAKINEQMMACMQSMQSK